MKKYIFYYFGLVGSNGALFSYFAPWRVLTLALMAIAGTTLGFWFGGE
jgi:hypothetical protein